jgi:hypothetical protein
MTAKLTCAERRALANALHAPWCLRDPVRKRLLRLGLVRIAEGSCREHGRPYVRTTMKGRDSLGLVMR